MRRPVICRPVGCWKGCCGSFKCDEKASWNVAQEIEEELPADFVKQHPRLTRALSIYRPRNHKAVDVWSFVHLVTCALLALTIGPLLAWLIALFWEPLEVRVLSPWLARRGIDFGHEGPINTLIDVVFNSVGVLAALWLMVYMGWQAPLSPF